MFENIKNEPEDLFAETDASAPQVASPTSTSPAPGPAMNSNPSPSPASAPVPAPLPSPSVEGASRGRSIPWKMIILFVAIITVIVLAFFLSMRILKSRTPVTPSAPTETKKELIEEAPAVQKEVIAEEAPEVPLEIDTDKDGLTDSQEAGLGTNPNSTDTDADGLFDREEVEVYKINPLNPDTDGDTFLDGAEVKAGYNPNGPGKLLEIPQK